MTEPGDSTAAPDAGGRTAWGWLAPWLIFAGALALRLAYLWQAGHADAFFTSVDRVDDSRFYDMSARAVAGGQLAPAAPYFLAPLYFYVMGALYALVGPHVVGVQILQCVLGAASCVLVQRIGGRVFGERVGHVAGVLLAVYGLHVYYSGVILPTVLVTFLNLLFLWLVIDVPERPGRARLLAAGGVLGLAVAAKPNAILMLPAVAGALYFVERAHGVRAWAGRMVVLAAGCAAVMLPFIVHNYAASGEFVFMTTTGGRNLYKGNGPFADGSHVFFPDDTQRTGLTNYLIGDVPAKVAIQEDQRLRSAARRYMLEHPGRTAALWLKKLLLFFNATELAIRDQYYFAWRYSWLLGLPLLGFGAAMPIALVALAVAWRGRPRALVLYAAIAAQVASFVPLFVLARYRMVSVACLLVFAAFGVVAVLDLLRERRWRLLAGGGAAWLLAFTFVHLPFAEFPRERGFADQWQRVGDQDYETGDYAAALQAYTSALGADWLHENALRRQLETRLRIARTLLAQGDLAGARRELDQVKAQIPEPREGWSARVAHSWSRMERRLEEAAGGPAVVPRPDDAGPDFPRTGEDDE